MPRVIFKLYQGAEEKAMKASLEVVFFWVFVFIINQINTARGLDNEMRVIEE